MSVGWSSAIFLTAIAAVALLSHAPFGELYATMLGRAEHAAAEIVLMGGTKPELSLVVAKENGGRFIVLTLTDPVAGEAKLKIPSDWHVEEVRYAFAADIGRYDKEGMSTLLLPLPNHKIELRLSATEPFEAISFSHDGTSSALLSLTSISPNGGAPREEVKIVEREIMLEL